MKKFLLSLMCVISAFCIARADSGDIGVGIQLAHGSKANQIGLGARVQIGFTDELRLEPSFNYYFRQDHVATWDVDINLHYVLDVTDGFSVYPLGGIFVSNWDFDPGSDTRFGANLGAGALKYMLTGDYRQLATLVGVTFKF